MVDLQEDGLTANLLEVIRRSRELFWYMRNTNDLSICMESVSAGIR